MSKVSFRPFPLFHSAEEFQAYINYLDRFKIQITRDFARKKKDRISASAREKQWQKLQKQYRKIANRREEALEKFDLDMAAQEEEEESNLSAVSDSDEEDMSDASAISRKRKRTNSNTISQDVFISKKTAVEDKGNNVQIEHKYDASTNEMKSKAAAEEENLSNNQDGYIWQDFVPDDIIRQIDEVEWKDKFNDGRVFTSRIILNEFPIVPATYNQIAEFCVVKLFDLLMKRFTLQQAPNGITLTNRFIFGLSAINRVIANSDDKPISHPPISFKLDGRLFGDDDYVQQQQSILRGLFVDVLRSNAIKHHGQSDLMILMKSMESTFVLHNSGGCSERSSRKQFLQALKCPRFINCPKFVFRWNLKGGCNNCLFNALAFSFDIPGDPARNRAHRKELNLLLNAKIPIDKIDAAVQLYNQESNKNKGWILFNEFMDIVTSSSNVNISKDYMPEDLLTIEKDNILLQLDEEHYYPIELDKTQLTARQSCEQCGRGQHLGKCDAWAYNFQQIHRYRKPLIVMQRKHQTRAVDYNDEIIYWQVVCFQGTKFGLKPFASALLINQAFIHHYGENCIKDSLQVISKLENKKIICWNANRFILPNFSDFREAFPDISPAFVSNKVFYNLDLGTNRILDMTNFIADKTFEEACINRKLEASALKFDFTQIQSWEATEPEKIKAYLELFTTNLHSIFKATNQLFWNQEKMNLVQVEETGKDFNTLRQANYTAWLSKEIPGNGQQVEVWLPTYKEYNEFIKPSILAARVNTLISNFKSNMSEEIQSTANGSENIGLYKKLLESGSYLKKFDANGLYCAAITNNEINQNVQFGVGKYEIRENGEQMFKENKPGFYYVYWVPPPTGIKISTMPSINAHGSVDYLPVERGQGVRTSVDIQNMLDSNYTVGFIGRCLIANSSAALFDHHLLPWNAIKVQTTDPSEKSVAKAIIAQLWGVLMTKCNVDKLVECKSSAEVIDFLTKYDIVDEEHTNDSIVFNGIPKTIDAESSQRQVLKYPSHLAAFTLGFARKIMLKFMRIIDPELKSLVYYQTSTDSLFVDSAAENKLKTAGMIHQDKLGFLKDDLKGGLIFNAQFFSSGTQRIIHYITDDDKTHIEMQAPGFSASSLAETHFNGASHKIEEIQTRRVGKKRNRYEAAHELNEGDVYERRVEKSFKAANIVSEDSDEMS